MASRAPTIPVRQQGADDNYLIFHTYINIYTAKVNSRQKEPLLFKQLKHHPLSLRNTLAIKQTPRNSLSRGEKHSTSRVVIIPVTARSLVGLRGPLESVPVNGIITTSNVICNMKQPRWTQVRGRTQEQKYATLRGCSGSWINTIQSKLNGFFANTASSRNKRIERLVKNR